MSYMGGKANSAAHILEVLNDPLFNGMNYVEPFVGYAHVLRRVVNKRTYSASDVNPLLITLLRAVQRGTPIPEVSAKEYMRLKKQTGNTLRRAVAAFTYSYNGKEWGGYTAKYSGCASTGVRFPPEERKRYYDKLHSNEAFQQASLSRCSYAGWKPKRKLIYCDPPYEGTTSYGNGEFDHAHFWQTVREWSRDNIVFVSEYRAPPDFVQVSSGSKDMGLRGADLKERRTERLFMHPRCRKHIEAREEYFAERDAAAFR